MRVYRDEVVFPLRAVAADPSKDLDLRLNLTFAVCKEVCIPISVKLAKILPAKATGTTKVIAENHDLISRFMAAVPTANQQLSGIRINNVRLDNEGGKPVLLVDLLRTPQVKDPMVLIEVAPGEPPEAAKGLERPKDPKDNEAWTFALALDVAPKKATEFLGRRVRVTVFDGGRSLEQIWVIGTRANRSGQYGAKPMAGQKPGSMDPPDESWKPHD